MNEIPSAQFRTAYAKLTEPTVVTVNGHPIGTWTPIAGGAKHPHQHVGPVGTVTCYASHADPPHDLVSRQVGEEER